MIFVDSYIPMYLIGAPHPIKAAAQRLLEQCIDAGQRLVTDAEVLQEILHRYTAINRRDAIRPAFDALLGVVDDVLSIERRDVERAGELLQGLSGVSARDALHGGKSNAGNTPRWTPPTSASFSRVASSD